MCGKPEGSFRRLQGYDTCFRLSECECAVAVAGQAWVAAASRFRFKNFAKLQRGEENLLLFSRLLCGGALERPSRRVALLRCFSLAFTPSTLLCPLI